VKIILVAMVAVLVHKVQSVHKVHKVLKANKVLKVCRDLKAIRATKVKKAIKVNVANRDRQVKLSIPMVLEMETLQIHKVFLVLKVLKVTPAPLVKMV
jgi:hypothetical protein